MHEFDAGGSARKSGTNEETNELTNKVTYGGVLSHCLTISIYNSYPSCDIKLQYNVNKTFCTHGWIILAWACGNIKCVKMYYEKRGKDILN